MHRLDRAKGRPSSATIWELAACWEVYLPLTLLAVSHTWTNARQPAPYMDELFHVPQAQRICDAFPTRVFSVEYDTAITTPPGLYLVPAVLNLFSPYFCSTQGLRLISAAFVALSIPNISAILQRLKTRFPETGNATETDFATGVLGQNAKGAVLVALHPVLFFYGNLFYTDPPAVFFLLLCFRLSLAQRPLAAALCGLFSASCRQTCAVLHGYIAFDELLDMRRRGEGGANAVRTALPHLAVGMMYVCLFRWNSYHVALGHQAHHPISLHLAMLPYYTGFLALFGAPSALAATSFAPSSRLSVTCFVEDLRKCRRVQASAMLGTLTLFACVFATGDYVHPFTLSDNRHFVFYLYRRVLLRGHLVRHAALPVYLVGLAFPFFTILLTRDSARKTSGEEAGRKKDLLLTSSLQAWRNSELLSEGSLLMAMTLCVVPSTLLELRYFVPGFVLVSIRGLSRAKLLRWQTYGALLLLVFCNLLLVLLYCEASFQRARDSHMPNDSSPGRFMF